MKEEKKRSGAKMGGPCGASFVHVKKATWQKRMMCKREVSYGWEMEMFQILPINAFPFHQSTFFVLFPFMSSSNSFSFSLISFLQ